MVLEEMNDAGPVESGEVGQGRMEDRKYAGRSLELATLFSGRKGIRSRRQAMAPAVILWASSL